MSKKSRYRSVKECKDARFIEQPAFTRNQKLRGSQKAGAQFEARVQRYLDELFGERHLPNCWISYVDSVHGKRVCSPDSLIIDPVYGYVVVVEIKLSHTYNAYRQLEIYEKVVSKLFPGYEVRGVEVCHAFVGGTDYPVQPHIIRSFFERFNGIGNVMLWRN